MSRPAKETVDYFPHVTSQGKTLFVLQNLWGNDGYAVWFKMLERLGSTVGHVINLNDETEYAYLAAYCGVQPEILKPILDQCAALHAIDPDLWGKRIIYSQNFVDGVSDAYRRRKEKLPSLEKVKCQFSALLTAETPLNVISDGNMPVSGKIDHNSDENEGIETPMQGFSKPQQNEFMTAETQLLTAETPLNVISDGNIRERERERERKENIKKKSSLPDNFKISERVKKWASQKNYFRLDEHMEAFKLACLAKNYRYIDWDAAFMNAVRANWAKLDNHAGGNGNNGSPTPKLVTSAPCQRCGAVVLSIDRRENGCIFCER